MEVSIIKWKYVVKQYSCNLTGSLFDQILARNSLTNKTKMCHLIPCSKNVSYLNIFENREAKHD